MCLQLWSVSRYKQFKYQHEHKNGYTKGIEKYCLNGQIIQHFVSYLEIDKLQNLQKEGKRRAEGKRR